MTVTVPEYAGCPWPMDAACQTDEWLALAPAVQARSLALASSTLHRLSGYRVGECSITVRPCSPRCGVAQDSLGMYGGVGWGPALWAGVWSNACGCGASCGCTSYDRIVLSPPVGRIDSVKVNGTVLPTTAYELRGGRYLVNLTDTPWPAVQDLSKPDTQAGTFSVTYLNAYPVDALGAYAVGILAAEFARACTTGKCRLPSGVTQIVRQGVSMTITPGAFPNGLTGIREVDAWIGLWNPEGLKRPATVWTPDMARG